MAKKDTYIVLFAILEIVMHYLIAKKWTILEM